MRFYFEYPPAEREAMRASRVGHEEEGYLAIDINHGRRLAATVNQYESWPDLVPDPGIEGPEEYYDRSRAFSKPPRTRGSIRKNFVEKPWRLETPSTGVRWNALVSGIAECPPPPPSMRRGSDRNRRPLLRAVRQAGSRRRVRLPRARRSRTAPRVITFPYLNEEELVSRVPDMAARIWNLECSAAERFLLGFCLAITDGSGDRPVHGEHTADDDESDPRFAELWQARDRIFREHTTDDRRVLTTPLELSEWL